MIYMAEILSGTDGSEIRKIFYDVHQKGNFTM